MYDYEYPGTFRPAVDLFTGSCPTDMFGDSFISITDWNNESSSILSTTKTRIDWSTYGPIPLPELRAKEYSQTTPAPLIVDSFSSSDSVSSSGGPYTPGCRDQAILIGPEADWDPSNVFPSEIYTDYDEFPLYDLASIGQQCSSLPPPLTKPTPTEKELQYMQLVCSLPRPRSILTADPARNNHTRSITGGARQSTLPEQTLTTITPTTTTLLEYLSLPNPLPSIAERVARFGPTSDTHFWFDVRSIHTWSDFNVETMVGTPELWNLLRSELSNTALPISIESSDTNGLSHNAYHNHFGAKLNAVLDACNYPTSDPYMKPDFVSNYANNKATACESFKPAEFGRIIGIVMCHKQWSSSMRNGKPSQQVGYRDGLSRLQHVLRTNGYRYGFIMTEHELVCVRHGGNDQIYESSKPAVSNITWTPPADTSIDSITIFGYVEVSEPILMSTHTQQQEDQDKGQQQKIKMTIGLALWYLNMLSLDTPLPKQYDWKLVPTSSAMEDSDNVTAVATMTRLKYLNRDANSPRTTIREARLARRRRGWFWPDEGAAVAAKRVEKRSRRGQGRGKK
jgi:hypothetical protein